MNIPTTERTLTELDHVRLKGLVQRHRHGAAPSVLDDIGDMLDEASIVPSTQVAADVVTMYSKVLVEDPVSGQRSTLTVCYPPDARPEQGFVSALSPVGLGLLGRRNGDLASWSTPSGERRTAKIVAILFQPEAQGDYTT
jgi:regulator of nucleoside diphosphate kinase